MPKKLKQNISLLFAFIIVFQSINLLKISADDRPSKWAETKISEIIEKDYIRFMMQNNYKEKITREDFTSTLIDMFSKRYGFEKNHFFVDYLEKNRKSFNIKKDANLLETKFQDLSKDDSYSQKRIAIAYNLEIINGKSEKSFDPKKSITREEAAKLLNKFYQVLEENFGLETPVTRENYVFLDDNKISNWAKEHVYLSRKLGLMKGVGGERFDPKGSYTREQAIISLYRVIENINELNSYQAEKQKLNELKDKFIEKTRYKFNLAGDSYTVENMDKVFSKEEIKGIDLKENPALSDLKVKINSIYKDLEKNFNENYSGEKLFYKKLKSSAAAFKLKGETIINLRYKTIFAGTNVPITDIHSFFINITDVKKPYEMSSIDVLKLNGKTEDEIYKKIIKTVEQDLKDGVYNQDKKMQEKFKKRFVDKLKNKKQRIDALYLDASRKFHISVEYEQEAYGDGREFSDVYFDITK